MPARSSCVPVRRWVLVGAIVRSQAIAGPTRASEYPVTALSTRASSAVSSRICAGLSPRTHELHQRVAGEALEALVDEARTSPTIEAPAVLQRAGGEDERSRGCAMAHDVSIGQLVAVLEEHGRLRGLEVSLDRIPLIAHHALHRRGMLETGAL